MRRKRGGLPPHRGQLGTRPSRAGTGRDIRKVIAGDPSPDGKEVWKSSAGSRSDIFQLRTEYSEAMKATFLDERATAALSKWAATASASPASWAPRSAEPRRAAASPSREPIAPFHVACSDRLWQERRGARCRRLGISRAHRSRFRSAARRSRRAAGAMFADMELIGIPPSHLSSANAASRTA